MIKEIYNAFCLELKELFKDTMGATVLRDTHFDQMETPAFELPCIILGLSDSPDQKQLSGGVTQGEWNWNIRVYFIDSNAELGDDQAFSTGDYSLIEKIVNHLNFQTWLTDEFQSVVDTYNFKLTYNDVSKAPQLIKSDGGMIPGYQISYNSIGLDLSTAFTVYSTSPLQKAEQVPFDLISFAVDSLTLEIAQPAGSHGEINIISNTPWIVLSIPPWATIDKYEGKTDDTITLTASVNLTGVARTGNVVISAPLSDEDNKIIVVTQLSS